MSYEYTTAALVQAELRSSTAFSTSTTPTLATVENWIEEESEDINKIAGYNIGETSYTDTINWDGSDILILKHSPIITFTTLNYSIYKLGSDDYDITLTATEGTDYSADKEKGILHILSTHTANLKEGLKSLKATYTAGYATTPKNIEKLATKKVVLRVIDSLLSYNINSGNSGGSVSVGSISIVEPADFGTVRFNTLKQTVKEEEDKLSSGSSAYRYINY